MELITAAVTGPLCFLAVVGLVRHTAWRYLAMLAASLCQLYGLVRRSLR